jgi:hypothetical protein
MNDYWNNPPEYPEPPECCGDFMDVEENGSCWCSTCGKRIEPMPDIEPVPEVNFGNIEHETLSENCRHGRKYGECNTCEHLDDIAFDSAREARLFR